MREKDKYFKQGKTNEDRRVSLRKRKIHLEVSPSLHMLFIHPLKGPLRLLSPPRLNPRLWDSTTTKRTTNARSNAIKNFFMSRLLRMERMNLERLSRLAFSKQPFTDQITPDLPRNHFLPAELTKCKRTLPSTSEIKIFHALNCFRSKGNDFASLWISQ